MDEMGTQAELKTLARITAIMEREGGWQKLSREEIVWMASQEGSRAMQMWHTFRDLVQVFDATMTEDWYHQRDTERKARR